MVHFISSEFVSQAWNAVQPRSCQVTGAKSQAVKNLLEMTDTLRNSIYDVISRYGWKNCPFSDDNLGDKRITVGSKMRLPDRKWVERLTITNESAFLAVQSISIRHSTRSNGKKKLDKNQCYDMFLQAAFVLAVANEVKQEKSIQD